MDKEKKILVISVNSEMTPELEKVARHHISIHGGEILIYHVLELPYPTPTSQDYDLKEVIPAEKYNRLMNDFEDIPHQPKILIGRDISKVISDKVLEVQPDLLISDFDKVKKLKLDELIFNKIVIYDINKN